MQRNREFKNLTDRHNPKSALLKHLIGAFAVGGAISFAGQWLFYLFSYLGLSQEDAYLSVTLSFIFLASVATSLGFFDRLATLAGAGTLVPVTGFSNAVTSSAIDTRSEGYISGVGTKIFTVAGPVILYAAVAGTLYGFIYFLWNLLF